MERFQNENMISYSGARLVRACVRSKARGVTRVAVSCIAWLGDWFFIATTLVKIFANLRRESEGSGTNRDYVEPEQGMSRIMDPLFESVSGVVSYSRQKCNCTAIRCGSSRKFYACRKKRLGARQ